MANYVQNVQVMGLFDRFNIEQDFYPGINVIFGINGGCKTTLLHILANAMNGDFERFAFIRFKEIIIRFDDARVLSITRRVEKSEFGEPNDFTVSAKLDDSLMLDSFSVNEIESNEASFLFYRKGEIWDLDKLPELNTVLPVTYIPAFRSVIDAWKSSQKKDYFVQSEEVVGAQATFHIRRWLLPFVPRINYPSLGEIEKTLVVKGSESSYIEKYLNSLNEYLDRKRVEINKDQNNSQNFVVEIVYEDGMRSKGLDALSSGERQIAILFFVTSNISSDPVILIDEPEMSLHVDWQRKLIKDLAKQCGNKQIITCTHSPIIGADEENRMELVLLPYNARGYDF